MSDAEVPAPDGTAVTDETREVEHDDGQVQAGADRMPTPEEEAVADAQPPVSDDVAANYQHQAELGANIEGEGEIS